MTIIPSPSRPVIFPLPVGLGITAFPAIVIPDVTPPMNPDPPAPELFVVAPPNPP